jgi:hypothetical protein
LAASVFGYDEALVQPIATRTLTQAAVRPLDAGLLTGRFERDYPGVPVLDARAALGRLRAQLTQAVVWPAR